MSCLLQAIQGGSIYQHIQIAQFMLKTHMLNTRQLQYNTILTKNRNLSTYLMMSTRTILESFTDALHFLNQIKSATLKKNLKFD